MKFNKLIKNKKVKVILLIYIIIVLIMGNNGEEKKESQPFSTCNSHNGPSLLTADWIWEDGTHYSTNCAGDELILCENVGCVVATVVSGSIGFNPDVCVPYGLNGWAVDKGSDCKSGCTGSTYEGKSVCKACDKDDKCDSEIQQGFADFIDSIWVGNPFNSCGTKFYVATGTIGFVGVLLLMAAL